MQKKHNDKKNVMARGSFLFLPIENGFGEAVVIALTPKKQAPRLQTITPRQREAKKRTYNGAPQPLYTRANNVRPTQKSTTAKKRNGKDSNQLPQTLLLCWDVVLSDRPRRSC
jgi:hypothetical protein